LITAQANTNWFAVCNSTPKASGRNIRRRTKKFSNRGY